VRLFCLPFAGGAASIYRPWGQVLSEKIEVCPVQLPGRENRYSEKPITDAYVLAKTIANEMLPYLERPYAIFGHSMGALLTFEIARELARMNAPSAKVLLFSAHRAPRQPRKRPLLHALPDQEFIDNLRQYGGFPAEIIKNKEFIDFILPTMRADMTLCDLYAYRNDDPALNIPFEVYAGAEDQEAGPEEMVGWGEHTMAGSNLKIFDGGHFFLRTHSRELLECISKSLHVETMA
jgi:surfactin synthase thioesterase subunit